VIRSFRDRDTERLWHRERVGSFDSRVLRTALRKLAILDAAVNLEDLRVPPDNRLEALKGDRRGQHSIRINVQWRICLPGPTPARKASRSWTTAEEVNEMSKLAPIHPGEVLMEDFIEPLGITQHKVAVAIGVPPRRINEIVHGKRRITADTALRLSRYLGTTDLFWINLQNRYELEVQRDALGDAPRQHPAAPVDMNIAAAR
jgi:addiction module HigA family antidote